MRLVHRLHIPLQSPPNIFVDQMRSAMDSVFRVNTRLRDTSLDRRRHPEDPASDFEWEQFSAQILDPPRQHALDSLHTDEDHQVYLRCKPPGNALLNSWRFERLASGLQWPGFFRKLIHDGCRSRSTTTIQFVPAPHSQVGLNGPANKTERSRSPPTALCLDSVGIAARVVVT